MEEGYSFIVSVVFYDRFQWYYYFYAILKYNTSHFSFPLPTPRQVSNFDFFLFSNILQISELNLVGTLVGHSYTSWLSFKRNK